MTQPNAAAGGYLQGRSHSQGGIKGVNVTTGQPIEVEGGEVIINKKTVADPKKYSLNGKPMTSREILSFLNVQNGGVAFADGGVVGKHECKCSGGKYTFEEQEMTDHEIVDRLYAQGGMFGDEYSPKITQLRELAGTGKRLSVSSLPKELTSWIPDNQLKAITMSSEHWDIMADILGNIKAMPVTYATDGVKKLDKIVYVRYFVGNTDIYIVEKDIDSRDLGGAGYQCYGFVVLNGDFEMAEYGYVSIPEIKAIPRMEMDFFWTPITLREALEKAGYIEKDPAIESQPKAESLIEKYKNSSQSQINNAIRELVLRSEDPNDYSADEFAFIRLYEGAGGLAKEGETGTRLNDQFFTPQLVVEKMWGLAFKYGFKFENANILEPAVGSGRFLSCIPFYSENVGHVLAFDVDETCTRITKILYPEVDVRNNSFESMFFIGKRHTGLVSVPLFFDLVIGNPPYREYVSQYAPLGEKKATGALTFEMYFIMRGVDVLKKGGLLIYIVPNTFLSNNNKYNSFKESLNLKAELLDAYRLPNGIFDNTGVGTDIIVLRKR